LFFVKPIAARFEKYGSILSEVKMIAPSGREEALDTTQFPVKVMFCR
jgi:hypothetical protein